ncbi:hypothetical protein [Thermococcus sp.]|uniref:hypothetical protein n=1 Tax=Thermococcus sp. TaxID=35749 RepID=UPI0025CE981E|nr:hypothetical protein [Thermococcus sp.]
MKRVVLLSTLLVLMLALPAKAQSINCDGNATYSNGKVQFICELTNVTGFYELDVFANGVHVYKTSDYSSDSNKWIYLTVSFHLRDVLPKKFEIFPDITFSRVMVPINASLTEHNNLEVTKQARIHKVLSIKFGSKEYSLLIWPVLVFLAFFMAPTFDYKSGWDFAVDIVGLQLLFRGGGFGWLIAPIVMPFMSYRVITDGELSDSVLALGGLTGLFLLQSAYSLGFNYAKYPKISFYTGLEWIPGLPLAFYFIWPDYYVTPLFVGFFLSIPLFVTLWKYAELPYSKCHKVLSLFRNYSIPLSVGVALVLALQYTTRETVPLFIVLLISLFAYTYTSRLTFDKLEWAKKRFDKDIERIRRKW